GHEDHGGDRDGGDDHPSRNPSTGSLRPEVSVGLVHDPDGDRPHRAAPGPMYPTVQGLMARGLSRIPDRRSPGGAFWWRGVCCPRSIWITSAALVPQWPAMTFGGTPPQSR